MTREERNKYHRERRANRTPEQKEKDRKKDNERHRINRLNWTPEQKEKSNKYDYERNLIRRAKPEYIEKEKTYNRIKRIEAMTHIMYGTKPLCIICGEDFYPLLQIDHINNDGYKWRKIHGNGKNFYGWLKKNNYPSEPALQILCANCNYLKNLGVLITELPLSK